MQELIINLPTSGVFYLLYSERSNCCKSSVGRYGIDILLYQPMKKEQAVDHVNYFRVNNDKFVNEVSTFLLAN